MAHSTSVFRLAFTWMLLNWAGLMQAQDLQELLIDPVADTSKVYEYQDDKLGTKPTFPGGESAYFKFIQQNIRYPKAARKNGIQGLLALSFVIAEDGSITRVKVLKGIGGGCDEESIRLLQSMPNWIPGTVDGKPVKVKYVVPIKFKLY